MGCDIGKKSCLRKNKTNYCRVQFIDDENDPLDHTDITPPASPVDCSNIVPYYYDDDIDNITKEKMSTVTSSQSQQIKKKTRLLELQIQHLQLQLIDRDQRLAMNDDVSKYSKVSHLVNQILPLSRTDYVNEMDQWPTKTKTKSSSLSPSHSPSSTNRQHEYTLENIHDHLQHILFNLVVTQQQQTRLQYDPHDEYQQHTTSIYF
ncbi:hypothetical protein BCR42DRAFT_427423 [Absidia repens]|uniref:Uncharacterized protein n=1 Tax=Absidia repens TaxID=90262 RepID=A0A1X2HZ91_9FUNG|nr:hypothetical protein BCR42DRAFT_427423 [Absidia repens]